MKKQKVNSRKKRNLGETTKGSSDLFSRKAPAGYRYLEVHEVLEVP